ncbi:hypothetical protein ACHAXR_007847 [Thalassiosira sp. AJA248-18]
MQHCPDPSTKAKEALRECLASIGLPPGLLSSVYKSYQTCEARMWVLDNSSQMKKHDSHILAKGNGEDGDDKGAIKRMDNVTRWKELQECVAFHSAMAAKCFIPTKYWLVNDPAHSVQKMDFFDPKSIKQHFNLCHKNPGKDVASELNHIRFSMKHIQLDQSPCPLAFCLRSLHKSLLQEAPKISAQGGHVALVLCTQGKPTDKHGTSNSKVVHDFVRELSRFAELDVVRIIVRLCTDDENVRDMFNTLDRKFDSVDVLDDFWGEAREVYLHNPWLTYTMGLHRLRESALAAQVIDHLDEEPLSLDEIHQLCNIMFLGDDNNCIDLPHPHKNWDNFIRVLKVLVKKEPLQWNPIKKKMTPWINLKKLEAMHKGGDSSQFLRSSLHKHQQKHENGPTEDLKQQPRHHRRTGISTAGTETSGEGDTLALKEALKLWSSYPPEYTLYYPLQRILVTIPRIFPPTNALVEPHEYFEKWKTFDEEAFADETGEELKALLKRAVRKSKFFFHPDKRPHDLTPNQTLLFDTCWHVIQDRERVYLG